ncbi:MAG: acylneuraminate cytidylyltransferase family protein, partial [bacterium]
RTADDIDASIQLAMEKSANGVVSVCKTVQNPYLMKRESKDGTLHDFMDMNITYPRRQILPLVYFPNGAIYWVKNCVFLEEKSFFPTGTYPYIMPEERSLQIDTHWDFHVMELILRAKNCG